MTDFNANHLLRQLTQDNSISEQEVFTLKAMFPLIHYSVPASFQDLLKTLSTSDWIFYLKKYLPRFKELGYSVIDVRLYECSFLPFQVIRDIESAGFKRVEKPHSEKFQFNSHWELNKGQYFTNYGCLAEQSRYLVFSTDF